jgi:hypothetical protein
MGLLCLTKTDINIEILLKMGLVFSFVLNFFIRSYTLYRIGAIPALMD